jgi:hypothetical protein
MRVLSLRSAAVLLAAGVGLGGCAYGPYGGVSVGVGYGDGYYDPYYDGYSPYGYSPYGYYGSRYGGYGAYGAPYWGWYDNYYYPGTGYYVYDRYRNPYRWSDRQRRYWEQRRRAYQSGDRSNVRVIEQWGDFRNRDRRLTTDDVIRRSYEPNRTVRRQEWIGRAREQAERRRDQAERRESRAESRREFIERRRSEVRERAREKRGDD